MAAVLLLAGIVLIGRIATAQVTEDRATIVTFSGPVSLPGVTLPAGTYLFRLADSPANRNIVQVYDRDRTKIYATLLAIPAERNEVADDPIVRFRETPSDRPPAIRYWYFAGETSGAEFAYPKEQAMQIARASGEPVLAGSSTSADVNEMQKGELTHVTANEAANAAATQPTTTAPTTTTPEPTTTAPTNTTTAPSAAASTTTAPTTTAPTTTAPTTEPSAGDTHDRSTPSATGTSGQSTPQSTAGTTATSRQSATRSRQELPKTASELPLVGLIGMVSLAALFALRARRVIR